MLINQHLQYVHTCICDMQARINLKKIICKLEVAIPPGGSETLKFAWVHIIGQTSFPPDAVSSSSINALKNVSHSQWVKLDWPHMYTQRLQHSKVADSALLHLRYLRGFPATSFSYYNAAAVGFNFSDQWVTGRVDRQSLSLGLDIHRETWDLVACRPR